MNYPPQEPIEVTPRYHPCFGGYAACSGVNPCKTCQRVRRERVDSHAVVAAGLNGMMLAALQVLAQHARQTGAVPEQLLHAAGIDPNVLGASPQRQVQAFWDAQEAALGELHKEMDGGELAGQFMVTDTMTTPPQVVMQIQRRYGQPQFSPMMQNPAFVPQPAAYVAPQPYVPPVPPMQQPSMPTAVEAGAGYHPVAAQSFVTTAPQVAGVDPPIPAPAPPPQPKPLARPKPLTAEDIAATAIPAATNGVPNQS